MHLRKLGRFQFASAVAVLASTLAFAGPLNPPPGPVTSTNKTLSEVEPRTAINEFNTPGDAVGFPSVFKITQPGSYYLTGNVTVPPFTRGIVVTASNVTIDLNGFTISGQANSVFGIGSTTVSNVVVVVNGTIETMGNRGVEFTNVTTGRIERVTVKSCAGDGIRTGPRFLFRDCIAESNSGTGFFASIESTFESCTARSNTLDGVGTGAASVIRGCVATLNGRDGFSAGTRGIVTDCTASENNIGFDVGSFGTITGNTAVLSVGVGFVVGSNAIITGNNASNNGTGAGASAGFLISGNNTRVEGNNSVSNDTGFQVTSVSNIILRNTASGNTTGWIIAAGNTLGPIVNAGTNAAAISGNSAASTLGSTDPNANFTY